MPSSPSPSTPPPSTPIPDTDPLPDTDPFSAPDPGRTRVHREAAALFRIAERHAATDDQRRRQVHPYVLAPHEAVRLVAFLLSGAAEPADGEPAVDQSDIVAALTLLPKVRAELDELEIGLVRMARGRGMTWQEVAFGLGLGTPQAARQRQERLAGRAVHDGARDGDAQGGDAQGGDAQGGDAQGGDAQGGEAQGGDARGGQAQDGDPQPGNS